MMAKRAIKQLLTDSGKWIFNGIKSTWKGFNGQLFQQEDSHILYDFTKRETLKDFICLSDKEVGGTSSSNLTFSKHGRLLFSGNVSTKVNKHMDIDHSGFCGIRSNPKFGLFNKLQTIDISGYDCIEIKYRGDGRPYFINIQTESMMLLNKYDLHQAFLFTKGGPYWEVTRIPLSHFLMTYKGYLQDEQFDFYKVRTIGVSLTDKKSGPFRLEIGYIKMLSIGFQPDLFADHNHKRFK